jgi:hypothetical protein
LLAITKKQVGDVSYNAFKLQKITTLPCNFYIKEKASLMFKTKLGTKPPQRKKHKTKAPKH